MKNTTVWLLLSTLALFSVASSQAQQPGSDTEKAVAALENQWLQSQKTNNAELLAPLLADTFVNTFSSGKVLNRAETLADAKVTKWTTVAYSDLRVTVTGTTAIATGGFTGKGTDPAGKPLDENERFTDTWVKMPNGKWQCVASHGSQIKP
jgi:ketosteroid isomerase-like protein